MFLKKAVLLSLVLLGGCVPFWREWMRPAPPARAPNAMRLHETWCYNSLGSIDCYAGPQRLPPESLVSVDPPSRFPLTREDHARALAEAERRADGP